MKKVVLSLLVGVALSSVALAEEDNSKAEESSKGGFFSQFRNAINPKNETQKVDGLVDANRHSACPNVKEQIGGRVVYVRCPKNATRKEEERWYYDVTVIEKKGKPSRTSEYVAYRDDSEGRETGYDYGTGEIDKVQNRFVFYYDGDGKTEVYVFGRCLDSSKCQLLDDFVVSSANFELKHDRAF